MGNGTLKSAGIFFFHYPNGVVDSNGLDDPTWNVLPTAVPAILLPPIIGRPVAHHARGVIDLPDEVAAGRMDLSSPLPAELTITADQAFFAVLWYSPTQYYLPDANGKISITFTSAMLSTPSGTIPGRFLLEIACDNGCNFSWSWGATIQPSTLSIIVDTTNFVSKLSWTAVLNATSYNVYKATVSGGPYTLLTSTSLLTYNDSAVDPSGTYFYIVKAVVAAVEGPASNEVSATYPALAVPFATALGGFMNKMPVSWNSVAGATSYDVYYSDGFPLSFVFFANVTGGALSTTITGLLNGHFYTVRVNARRGGFVATDSFGLHDGSGNVRLDFHELVWHIPPVPFTGWPYPDDPHIFGGASFSFTNAGATGGDNGTGSVASSTIEFENSGSLVYTGPGISCDLIINKTNALNATNPFNNPNVFIVVASAANGVLINQPINTLANGVTHHPFAVPAAVGDTITAQLRYTFAPMTVMPCILNFLWEITPHH